MTRVYQRTSAETKNVHKMSQGRKRGRSLSLLPEKKTVKGGKNHAHFHESWGKKIMGKESRNIKLPKAHISIQCSKIL